VLLQKKGYTPCFETSLLTLGLVRRRNNEETSIRKQRIGSDWIEVLGALRFQLIAFNPVSQPFDGSLQINLRYDY